MALSFYDYNLHRCMLVRVLDYLHQSKSALYRAELKPGNDTITMSVLWIDV